MNTNYSGNRPTFTATLSVNNFKLNQEKVSAVSKEFAKNTLHYTQDFLNINKTPIKRDDGSTFYILDFTNQKTSAGFILDIASFRKWFDETPVSDIAQSFTRAFKYAKLKENKKVQVDEIRKYYDSSMNQSQLNRMKYESTQNPVYKTLYERNEKRAKTLETELKKTKAHFENIENKIQDKSIGNLLNWWEEY